LTPVAVNFDISVQNSHCGAYAFRIHGSIYHTIGSLLPTENNPPVFSQIYVFDTSNEIRNRHSLAIHINVQTLQELQCLMNDINPIVKDFKTMAQFIRENPKQLADISMVFRAERVPDTRRYNAPTTSTEETLIRPHDGGFQRVNELNQLYDAISYALLFPSGQYGLNKDCESEILMLECVIMQFYSFRLMYKGS
ncbi:hypothetical protein K501DRAFT_173085, partial [Backusella circina FSU 941]